MLSINPFSILAETVSPIFMQMFVIVMAILVFAGNSFRHNSQKKC